MRSRDFTRKSVIFGNNTKENRTLAENCCMVSRGTEDEKVS